MKNIFWDATPCNAVDFFIIADDCTAGSKNKRKKQQAARGIPGSVPGVEKGPERTSRNKKTSN
jgi:hypothetical protein